jgi:hypothetical protein
LATSLRCLLVRSSAVVDCRSDRSREPSECRVMAQPAQALHSPLVSSPLAFARTPGLLRLARGSRGCGLCWAAGRPGWRLVGALAGACAARFWLCTSLRGQSRNSRKPSLRTRRVEAQQARSMRTAAKQYEPIYKNLIFSSAWFVRFFPCYSSLYRIPYHATTVRCPSRKRV